MNLKAPYPQKARVRNRTRRSSHLASESVWNRACARGEETEKRENKSQKCYISLLRGGATCEPISTIFGIFVGLANVITCAKSGLKIPNGFSMQTGGKTHVSL